MLKKRTALGRGLGALLTDSDTVNQREESPLQEGRPNVSEIPLSEIQVNPWQPRIHFERDALEELSESIRVHGIIQPITVRQLDSTTYQLISGERRVQASRLAGMQTIPAYVRTANDQQMLEMALIENIQREDLDPIEVATSYQRLIAECNLKQEELGDRVGKKRSTVNNYLRLLKLPPDIQAGLQTRKIDMGHARALINIDNVELQLMLFRRIVEEGLSVRKVEEMVRNLAEQSDKKKSKPKETSPNFQIMQVQARLSSHFGTRVQIRQGEDNKGEIKIPFMSADDLNRILDMLNM